MLYSLRFLTLINRTQGLSGSKSRQTMMAAIIIMFSCSSSATILDLRHLGDSDLSSFRVSGTAASRTFSSARLAESVAWKAFQRTNVSFHTSEAKGLHAELFL